MENRRRFTLAFVLVALGALVAYGAIVYTASMIALGELRQDAAAAQWQLFQRVLDSIQANQLQLTQEYAGREDLRQIARAVPAAAADLDQSLALSLRRRYQISLLILADAQGRPLYPIGPASAQTQLALASAPAQAALAGSDAGDLLLIEDQTMLLTAARVGLPDQPEVYGILLLGRPVNNALFEQVKAVMGRDLILARAGQIVAASRALSQSEAAARQECPDVTAGSLRRLNILTSPEGGSYVAFLWQNEAQAELGCLQLDLAESLVPSVGAAVTIASLVAILLGAAAAYLMARVLAGRLADASDALMAGERENARLYAEVQQLNSRLETLVGERTAQLHAAVSELQAAQAQLMRADRLTALGRLTAGVAHDLTEALTTILARLQALLQMEPDADRRAQLEAARQAALESQETLRRLRAFSSQRRARRELLDLNAVVREIVALLASALKSADIVCDLQLAGGLPKILADQMELQQVVLNLLQRARQAVEESAGPRRIVLVTETAGEMARLSILDNGPTPDAETLARLFEPPAEAGADLYVCRGIVEAHGGRIAAQAGPAGVGVCVIVELPLGVGPAARGL